jgi:hypothetical protein
MASNMDPYVKYMMLEMWLVKMHKECLITIRDFDSKNHGAVVEYVGERFYVDLDLFLSVNTYEEFREKLLNWLKEEAFWRAYKRGLYYRDWDKPIEGIHNAPRLWVRYPDPCGRDY